ncbi:TPA: hypothetical protein ACOEEE_004998 [Enterobacter hormaechei subsp. xiangfangensis]|uniref:hypothetical protein n=1 Tax=Enterobacter TaxID=547 RepID=UPI0036D2BBF1
MLSCSLKRELEMKLTENRVDTLIDTLNDLICDEQSITREQRENLIKTVATLGGLKERLRLISAEKEARQIAKNEKVKKPREPDLVFPRTGKPWLSEDLDVIHSIIDDIPGVVCGRGRNPTLRLWPAIFSGEIDVFPSERRNMGQEIGR